MGTLWIDVTDLKRWKGPRTGIPRVVSHISTHLLTDARAKPCVFDEKAGVFRPVEAADALFPGAYVAPAPAAPQGSAVIRGGGRLKRLLPAELRDPLRDLIFAAYRTLRGLWACLKAFPQKIHAKSEGQPTDALGFQKGDVLLALGSTWGSRGYGEAVWRLKRAQGFRVAHFIHDLIPVRFPHFFGPGFGEAFQAWALDALWISDLLITNSERSAADVRAFAAEVDVRCPPIEIVRLADEPLKVSAPRRPAHPALAKEFVLCVGTLEVRKNPELAYQAWKLLLELSEAETPQLVWVGSEGWLSHDWLYKVNQDPAIRDKILWLGGVSDEELDWLYTHCLFTIYPSQYEGWGLPVAESFARGKYVVTAGNSSMPEIGGALADYHSPWKAEELASLVARAIVDTDYRHAKEQEIRNTYQTTTWADCAQQVSAALDGHLPR